jgi:predicted O-methyltransferase YrrM
LDGNDEEPDSMKITYFKQNLMRLLCSQEGEEPFHVLRMITGGLSSPKTAKIINFAAKCCDVGDAYVEIGTYSGYTLCAAGYQTMTTCAGIDDLSMDDLYHPDEKEAMKEKIRQRIQDNLSRLHNRQNMMFIERDFRTIEKLEFRPDAKKIAVLYIDGFHDFEQTNKAFEWAEPQLADEAIVILDDLHIPTVYDSVMKQIKDSDKYEIVVLAKNELQDRNMTLDEYISTGLAVLHYRRPNA